MRDAETADLNGFGGKTWDAIVLGAGPAGALAARELAGRGARVLLVERKAFPRPKVCGACLNGRALNVLEAVGLGHLAAGSGVRLATLALGMAGRVIRLPLPGGVAIARSKLDAGLADAAGDAGATFLTETTGLVGEATRGVRRVRLTRGERSVWAEARAVVVAAGLGSRCVDGPGRFSTRVARGSRIGAGCVVSEFPAQYRPGTIFMAIARGGYVGMVRLEDGRLNIAAAFDPGYLKRSGTPGAAASSVIAEARLPAIASLVGAAWLGTLPLTRRIRPVAGERVFLVGDATGYTEPFTGEGMAWALAGAVEVASLAHRASGLWEPSLAREWIERHRRACERPQRTSRALTWLLHRPRLARTAYILAALLPDAAGLLIRRLNRAEAVTKPM